LLLVAVMVAEPGPTAVTEPPETVATEAFDDDHSTGAFGTGSPLTSTGCALSVPLDPTVRSRCEGSTVTDATVRTVTGSAHVARAAPSSRTNMSGCRKAGVERRM
jgi:hypothetical protein